MLFPMERVFEDYVAKQLVTQFPYLAVAQQIKGQYLVREPSGKARFQLRPDLELSGDGAYVIADTQWKIVNKLDTGNNYDIKQSDMYQMFAYNLNYQREGLKPETWLIYPKTTQFDSTLCMEIEVSGGGKILAIPFDLDSSRLELEGL